MGWSGGSKNCDGIAGKQRINLFFFKNIFFIDNI